MKVALNMEFSQSSKNAVIYSALKDAAEKVGVEVVNYGQFSPDDHKMTYNQCALLTGVLIHSGAADLVITGCGTGEGACIAANAMPGVTCGLVSDPLEAFLFTQVNNGNCISFPFAKGFGWGAELNFKYMFEKLFEQKWGDGFPPATPAAESEIRNAKILQELKKISHTSMEYILEHADAELVKAAFGGPKTIGLLEMHAKDQKLVDIVKGIIAG